MNPTLICLTRHDAEAEGIGPCVPTVALILTAAFASDARAADALAAMREIERDATANPTGLRYNIARVRPTIAADPTHDPAVGRALGAYESASDEVNAGAYSPQ